MMTNHPSRQCSACGEKLQPLYAKDLAKISTRRLVKTIRHEWDGRTLNTVADVESVTISDYTCANENCKAFSRVVSFV